MENLVRNTKEVTKIGQLNEVKEFFKTKIPGIFSYSTEQAQQIEDLYQLASLQDNTDPVGWIKDFERSNPRVLEVQGAKDRLGTILIMAQLYIARKSKAAQANKEKQSSRDF